MDCFLCMCVSEGVSVQLLGCCMAYFSSVTLFLCHDKGPSNNETPVRRGDEYVFVENERHLEIEVSFRTKLLTRAVNAIMVARLPNHLSVLVTQLKYTFTFRLAKCCQKCWGKCLNVIHLSNCFFCVCFSLFAEKVSHAIKLLFCAVLMILWSTKCGWDTHTQKKSFESLGVDKFPSNRMESGMEWNPF